MKIRLLALMICALIPASSFAAPVILTCDFSKAKAPSARMVELSASKKAVAHCSSETGSYEIAFAETSFKVTASEIDAHSANLTVRCTSSAPDGVYYYGGMPAGFNAPKTPWFYNSDLPGRCFLEGNLAITSSIEAEKNKSKMIVLPLAEKSKID